MSDELKLDETIARSSPGGVVDYSTFEALEEALDKADAPITEGGRFLTLVERVNALVARAQGPGEAVAWPETMPPDVQGALELAFLKAKPLASHRAAPKLYEALRAAMIAATPTREGDVLTPEGRAALSNQKAGEA